MLRVVHEEVKAAGSLLTLAAGVLASVHGV